MGAIANISNVTKRFGTAPNTVLALDNVSFQVDPGETVALTGPSGSGKSTLLYAIGGLEPAQTGEIEIAGIRLDNADPSCLNELRRKHIGFVFQDANLIPTLTALENVEMAVLDLPPSKRQKCAIDALTAVGLGDRLHNRPGQLSGGQCQRAGLARALAGNPALLLADEPTANLDSASAERVMRCIIDRKTRQNMSVLIATHDPRVSELCGRVLTLHDGRILS